ncbi:hypothetical protein BAC1_01666 [uncultured bacterium]|nr:hypothetical protein BAC1_01666 [uncultured bacterium]
MTGRNNKCPICESGAVLLFAEVKDALVHCNTLWKSREMALKARRGVLKLGFCNRCGHVFNTAFDPEAMKYAEEYENSLHFSPVFQDYARSLAVKLIERYGLYEKEIIEIGCGKGDFLLLMSELGGNSGIGFDASFIRDRNDSRSRKVSFIQDLYSEKYAHFKGDMILSRQVLEHIRSPRSFVRKMRSATGSRPGAMVFCEVPNFMHTIKELAVWDIIYEHYSYFTPLSFRRLFNSDGFRVQSLEEGFNGQFLCLEAAPVENMHKTAEEAPGLDSLMREVSAFFHRYTNKIAAWKNELEKIAARGQRAAVWGAGSKGVSFLNTLKTAAEIDHVIDINPYKQGNYVPGTGQEIVGPEALREIDPDLIIIMNPIYTSEIWETVKRMGLKCRLLTA